MAEAQSAIADTGKAEEPPILSSAYRTYALWILLLIYILNFLDRTIVNILAEPIKNDLGLKDWQIGMMSGLAFAVFYTVLGIPIARVAERANRPVIIAASLAVWSGFTAVCGFAQSFGQLVLARIGVGIGEAGCTPAAHSLITDSTPREKRASALAFYSLGIPLGSMAGMAFGGFIADAYGWRKAFLLAGIPGIILAVVAVATLREPRRLVAQVKAKADEAISFKEAMAELASKKSFWWMAVGAALIAFLSYGNGAFYGSFFFRAHSAELAQVAAKVGALTGANLGPAGFLGLALGLLLGLAAAVGVFIGGRVADWAAKRDITGYMTLCAITSVISLPFFIAAMLSGSAVAALGLLTVPALCKSAWYGPVYAAAQTVVRPRTRATAAAILLFIINLIGLGLGPLFIGTISDILSAQGLGSTDGLRWALISSSSIALMAGWCFWRARATFRDEVVG